MPRVTVIGGGLAGVLVAVHLLRQENAPVAITILEPRETLGAGIAYSTPEPHHIINVPASRMSADPEDPDSFTRWLALHGDAPFGDERDVYPRRVLYGAYIRHLLAGALASHRRSVLVHRRSRVRDIMRTSRGLIAVTDGDRIESDVVVLATGNPAPLLPRRLAALAGSPRCIVDPWRPGALADVPADARVLIVGTGLTMGDTVATLRGGGHRGLITAVSRRGEVPRRGLASPAAPFGDFDVAPATALGLLRLVRTEIRRATAAGGSWYGVLAAARMKAWSLWAALPPIEQRRAALHLRHPYELHRHVMPGPVHDLITVERARGTLQVMAAKLEEVAVEGSDVVVTLNPRGEAGRQLQEKFGVVVNCTGPAYADLIGSDPLWTSLGRHGLVTPDHTGIGPAVDYQGRAISATGEPQQDLFFVGTLARSAFGELTGVREIAMLARLVSETLRKGFTRVKV